MNDLLSVSIVTVFPLDCQPLLRKNERFFLCFTLLGDQFGRSLPSTFPPPLLYLRQTNVILHLPALSLVNQEGKAIAQKFKFWGAGL